MESQLNNKLATIQKDSQRKIDEMQTKLNGAEDKMKEVNRSQVSAESEFDKQKALLSQSVEFLEKAMEESKAREKELSLELKNVKKDLGQ